MLLDIGWRRERKIRWVLKRLTRQRVVHIVNPGGFWLVEQSLPTGDGIQESLRTCHLRGWVEPISPVGIPHIEVTSDGEFPSDLTPSHVDPIYRVTDAGWNQIHNIYGWILATFAVAFLTFCATIVSVWANSCG